MKVEVTLKMKTSPEADSKFLLTVGASETVASVKERLAGLQMIPFPDQDLVMNGEALPDGSKLMQCGVRDGAALHFVVKATGATLSQQLAELLQARDLSSDELGLLYCYKHGVAMNQALKMLGIEGKLQDFLKTQKQFLLEGGRVSLLREKANGGVKKDTDTHERHAAWCQAPKPCQEPASGACFISLPPGLADDSDADTTWTPDNEQYLELHNRISSRAFNSKVVQFLGDVVELVSQNIFLSVAHSVKGGSVGKGTAITGCTDAEVVFFLQGLPPSQHEKWLPPMLKSAASILKENLTEAHIQATDDSVHLRMREFSVNLRFSSVFESYTKALEALGEQGPDTRKFYASALAKERVQFIARQPPQVKVTMRLLKWWREQQEWSSKHSYPKDEILELMVVYSAVQSKPSDQHVAIANVMSLLSRFNEMRIVWSNYYSKDDVWTPLLRQRPLLMDPTNPFENVADPQAFDATELMQLAQTTHFFW